MPYWKQDTSEGTQTHILRTEQRLGNAAELELELDVCYPLCLTTQIRRLPLIRASVQCLA